MNNNIFQQDVFINHTSHVYSDANGEIYGSTTKFISSFEEDVNFDMMAGMVAKKRKRIFRERSQQARTSIETIAARQPMYERAFTKDGVLTEWEMKKNVAIKYGNIIHDNLERFGVNGYVETQNDGFDHYYQWFINTYAKYKNKYHEQVVYLDYKGLKLGGMIDFCFHKKGPKSMLNIRDFKTNEYKCDNSKIDSLTGEEKRYEYYFKEPLSHLENSSMAKYIIQQSIYAFMLEQLGFRIGNLGIIRMPWENKLDKPEIHYFAYMKETVVAMLDFAVERNNQAIFDADDSNFIQHKL